jgi:HTH-type transcriptional regulator/antitoxin HipB
MLQSIELDIASRLRENAEFRREWFRAELELGVPDQFRALREERDLTQTQLAAKAEMKQSAISRFEKSTDATWNFETLLKLAEALDAQLQIRVVRAEDAIARIEREERAAKLASTMASLVASAREAQEAGKGVLQTLDSVRRVLEDSSWRHRQFNPRPGADLIALTPKGVIQAQVKSASHHTEPSIEKETKGLSDGTNWVQRDNANDIIQLSPA